MSDHATHRFHGLPSLSQADPCASSILVDELDARPLQHRFNHGQRRFARKAATSVCSRRASRRDDRDSDGSEGGRTSGAALMDCRSRCTDSRSRAARWGGSGAASTTSPATIERCSVPATRTQLNSRGGPRSPPPRNSRIRFVSMPTCRRLANGATPCVPM